MLVNKEKQHFHQRLESVQKAIWDAEFHKVKLKNIREGIRKQYDRVKEDLESAKRRLETEQAKEEKDAALIERLENVIKDQEPQLDFMVKQMQGLDEEAENEENPQSVAAKLSSLRVMKEMLTEYVETL